MGLNEFFKTIAMSGFCWSGSGQLFGVGWFQRLECVSMVIFFPVRKAPEVGFSQLSMCFSHGFSQRVLHPGFHAITPGWCSQEAGYSKEAPGPLFTQPCK